MAKAASRGRFKERLKKALEDFDINAAEFISTEIHEAEAAGYEVTAEEDALWERLTKCIEMFRRNTAAL